MPVTEACAARDPAGVHAHRARASPTAADSAEKIAETAEVVRTQAAVAAEVGAEQLVAVATAAIRAPNRDELVSAVRRRAERT